MTKKYYSINDKYVIVGGILANAQGRLLDIGARDRVLEKYLSLGNIAYFSADLGGGHEFQFDLEQPLLLGDGEFDYVIALDVLEHVENIHQAFRELVRITDKQLIIGLPNMATISKRWSFFWRGRLGTAKYDLLPEHQGDRHRWLTVYQKINRFVASNCIATGASCLEIHEELIKPTYLRFPLKGMAQMGLMPSGLVTDRCIYVIEKYNKNG